MPHLVLRERCYQRSTRRFCQHGRARDRDYLRQALSQPRRLVRIAHGVSLCQRRSAPISVASPRRVP
jgi:hypothetical protein